MSLCVFVFYVHQIVNHITGKMPRKERRLREKRKELSEAAKGTRSLTSWMSKSPKDAQLVESDTSDEEMEGEKEEDSVKQGDESRTETEYQEETEAGGKLSDIEQPSENIEIEEAASQETEVGVREAEGESQPTENIEVEGAASHEETETRGRPLPDTPAPPH
ncbi:sodium/potassium/calcium exchanger 1, partial [Oryzias melastigma]|uniref:sodium/potassium/calcium exchanger 1 n=1 Tax=Oryzias melastigma TaxID=30732 RepID=UPI000CF7E9DA